MKVEPATAALACNKDLIGLICLRCEASYELDDADIDSGLGCKTCLAEGYPVGLRCEYARESKLIIDRDKTGMFRFLSKLPFCDFPSLGEGNTPVVPLPHIASEFGIESVLVKNEGQNPTGSHKDRMSPLAVARAISAGYNKVVSSSSGNAGASLASYAARAGIKCCIIAAPDISAQWAAAINQTGADLVIVDGARRWPLVQEMTQRDGWFPVTNFSAIPVGSNPFGIEGYKTIAHELVEQQQNAPPTMVIIPTCRGDVLLGVWRGFVESMQAGLIDAMPRLVAVEPGPRLELVLAGSDYRSVFEVTANPMTSIDGGTTTYQSFSALKASSGSAVSVNTASVTAAHRTLAAQGLFVEMSSASALAGLEQLKNSGKLQPSDRVVLLCTSHGYKEPLMPNNAAPSSRLCN